MSTILADPYSGRVPSGYIIPQWSVGEKLSDSGEEMGDSSDQSSVVQDSSDESGSEDGDGPDDSGVAVDLDRTPKGKGRICKGKGKGRAKSTDDESGVASAKSSTPSTSAKSTIRPRPRSNSKPPSFSPGPAATLFSKMTLASSSLPAAAPLASPSTSGGLRSSGFAARKPLSHNSRSGTLGRATSAPTNLFGGSPPVPRKSPGPKYKLAAAPTSSDPETEEDEQHDYPSSPESSIESIVNRAYDRRESDIDLSSKSLTTLPDVISHLANFVTWDHKTGLSGPTPIRLYLYNNFLTSAGLSPALFAIKNLEHLSLRSNNIEQIPQAIGQLKNLKQLMLFNNQLRCLPAEILDLKLEVLSVGSNPLLKYDTVVPSELEKQVATVAEEQSAESVPSIATRTRKLAPRKQNFRVPSLLELCTRKLLEPMPTSTASSKIKSFSPSASTKPTKRYFNGLKESLLSSKDEEDHPPAHLLKPFLPLLHPVPYHLRYLLPTDSGMPFNEAPAEIPQCSVCKTACSDFAEERMEWRHEVAGVKICPETDRENWVPVLWRGCSANCLDFLEEPL